jgi:hypothetical protein
MKQISKIVAVAAVGLLAASCIKDSAERLVWNNGTGGNGSGLQAGYALVVSAGGDSENTRASLGDYNPVTQKYPYTWNTNDIIKLLVTPVGSTTAISTRFDKIDLAATENGVSHSNFTRSLTAAMYADLQEAPTFDYYAYFPNTAVTVNDDNFPNSITFSLPSSYPSLAANSFAGAKTPMVAAAVKNHAPDIMFFENSMPAADVRDPAGDGGDGIHFTFDHTTSYAAIEFDVRLFSTDVTVSNLRMTMGSASNANTWICGDYTYDIASGTGSITGNGSNTILLSGTNILTIGTGQKLYIPMPVKDYSGQTFTFTYTLGSAAKGTYGGTTTTTIGGTGMNFESGKIHSILIAPKTAIYTASDSFTVSHTGYYFIEAWGGNGGSGGDTDISTTYGGDGYGAAGGNGLPIRGIYKLNANTPLFVQVGAAGTDGDNGHNYSYNTSNALGGTNGTSLGYGANGGAGGGGRYDNQWSAKSGAGGGGGGGASMVFRTNNTSPSNIIIASGGGGGGGGAGGSHNAGAGGNSNGTGGTVAGDSPHGDGGNGWSGSYTYGVPGNGSIDGTKSNSTTNIRGGGGGGGGGGGWNGATGGGGQSGTGGDTQQNAAWHNDRGAGGGGAGGQSSQVTPDALPVNFNRPSDSSKPASVGANGVVIITFVGRTDN